MSVLRQGRIISRKACPLWSVTLSSRLFHTSKRLDVLKPFLLADIGEGIREAMIVQWFVKPGARVEQFDKICEVQSDKANVEITSRFDGVIKKLHYDVDDMAIVGKPLVDIDIQSEISPEDEALTAPPTNEEPKNADASSEKQDASEQHERQEPGAVENARTQDHAGREKHRTLSTPAVRHMTKQLGVNIEDVVGTGKEGRVTKDDVQRYKSSTAGGADKTSTTSRPSDPDRVVALSPVQAQMFKTMTRSLSIPHFLYTESINMNNLINIRGSVNSDKSSSEPKISALAFILKAVSLAFQEYPLINARLDLSAGQEKPQLEMRGAHNLGIAVDTPQGLLVPVIKSVQDLSISAVASEIARLAAQGRDGKLSNADLTGGTFTVSNVGSIGGGVVAPVIVDSQLAILGIGKTKPVPAFDELGNVVRREVCVFSWSADHRVVDGATLARCAELVRRYIEAPEKILVKLQ
ncbi:MAG: hypothetical protein M1828_000406 [Chrysothrix sp. TS-e1954]|nr:MAG: hypothetical protein M1828_000406 [Chrysothrix sp. TS-e1954]